LSKIFHWGKTEGQKAETGVGFLGRGSNLAPHQLGDLGSVVGSFNEVRCGALTTQRLSTVFSTQDGLS